MLKKTSKLRTHPSPRWTRAKIGPAIFQDQACQVWRLSLSKAQLLKDRFFERLSTEEMFRASYFSHPEDRDRFIGGHGLVRELLGSAVKTDPSRIVIKKTKQGKPFLVGGGLSFQFNISHSGDWILVAVHPSVPIGVDVECLHRKMGRNMKAVAKRFFSRAELDVLDRCPEKFLPQVFFKIWTAKEAVLKADGRGVPFQLDAFDVVRWQKTKPAWLDQVTVDATHWNLWHLPMPDDYAAALTCLTTEHSQVDIKLFEL